MSFTKRWNPQPKPELCPTCKKRPAIKTRKDRLCVECASFIDEAQRVGAAKVAEKAAK